MADTAKIVGLIKSMGAKIDPSVIEQSVDGWLDDHPEATTTVEDGSITKAKLDNNLQGTVDDVSDLKSAIGNRVHFVFENKAIYLSAGYDFTYSVDNNNRVSTQPFFVPDGLTLFIHAKKMGRIGYSKSTNGTTVSSAQGLISTNDFSTSFVGPLYVRFSFAKATDAAIDTNDIDLVGCIGYVPNEIENLKNVVLQKPVKTLKDIAIEKKTTMSGDLVSYEGWNTDVYLLKPSAKYTIRRPVSSNALFLVSNILHDTTAREIKVIDSGSVYEYANTNNYKYLYIVSSKVEDPLYYATVSINNIAELPMNSMNNIDSNIVCTYKKMYVAKNGDRLLFSNDSMQTWSKTLDVTGVGLIKTYHLFDNGCIAFFTHTKAYYSEDWETLNEASVLESNGSAYSPSTYDNFTTSREFPERLYVNGQDIHVFGNYGITDENNTRRILWASVDNGHTYRVIYEFNVSGSYTIRHIHNVMYNPNFNKFICATGDSASQSHVIEFSYNNGSFSGFTSLGDGLDYKWAGIVWWGEYVYYCHDITPGKVMKCKYSEISDYSKHEIVLDNIPNDCIGLFIGERGDMLITQSIYRSGDTNSPFNASIDALNLYYSTDRVHFDLIRSINPSDGVGTFYGFFGTNKDGRILSGFWKSSINLNNWDKTPSVDLAVFVKNAGYPNAFKPINTDYEIVPVLQIECDDVSVFVNEEKELPVEVYPYNASVKTWSVIEYDPTYISIDGDSITGVSAGETEIAVRSNSNYEVTKKITVTVS